VPIDAATWDQLMQAGGKLGLNATTLRALAGLA
jgi:hypothetical protein